MIIIGLTGTFSAGKGTVVEFLKNKGFKHYSVSEDFLVPEIKKRGLPVNRDSMILVANDLRKNNGPEYTVRELFKIAEKNGENAIIESIRTIGEVDELRKKTNFILMAVDADRKLRYERAVKRKSSKDNVSFEDFVKQEESEMTSTDPNKQNLSACISKADVVFENNGTKDELFAQIENYLKEKNLM